MVAAAAQAATQERLNKAVWARRGQAEAGTEAAARELAAFFNAEAETMRRILEARVGPLDSEAKDTASRDDLRIDFSSTYWDSYEARLKKKVEVLYKRSAAAAYEDVSQVLGFNVSLRLNGRNISGVMSEIGTRVSGITETSRVVLSNIIRRGIEEGSSPKAIANNLLRSASLWGGGKSNVSASRAMTVARTETANAYNKSTLAAYKDSGLVKKLVCLDSPDCGWNGHNDSERAQNRQCTYEDAQAHPLSHPNCVRAFAPKLYPTRPEDEAAPRRIAGTGEVTPKPVRPEPSKDPIYRADFWDPFTHPNTVKAKNELEAARAASREAPYSERVAASKRVTDTFAAYEAAGKEARKFIDEEAARLGPRQAKEVLGVIDDELKRLQRIIDNDFGSHDWATATTRKAMLTESRQEVGFRLPLRERIRPRPATPGPEQLAYDEMLASTEELERLTGLKSRWSGVVRIGADLPENAAASFGWGGELNIGRAVDTMNPASRRKVIIHESLHGLSDGLTPAKYASNVGFEEGVVEMAAQTLEKKVFDAHGWSGVGYQTYGHYTLQLEDLRKLIVAGGKAEYDDAAKFYVALMKVPADERRAFVEKLLPKGSKTFAKPKLDYLSKGTLPGLLPKAGTVPKAWSEFELAKFKPASPKPKPLPTAGALPKELVERQRYIETELQKRLDNPAYRPNTVTQQGLSPADAQLHRQLNALADGLLEQARVNNLTVQETIDHIERVLAATIGQTPISSRRSFESFQRILDEGRFKSQFETGKSGGMLSPKHRATAEYNMFGFANDVDASKELRPIYGYARDADELASSGYSAAEGYGDVLFDFKESVRQRTTVVWTDSLGATAKPSPVARPRWWSWDVEYSGIPRGTNAWGTPYRELQFHGGLRIEDVHRITFTGNRNPGYSGEMFHKLKAAGFRQISATEWVR